MRRFVAIAVVCMGCNGDEPPLDTGSTSESTGDTSTDTLDTSDTPAGWNTVGDLTNLPAAALLSICGTSSSDVWTVGADPGDGDGPLFLHYDGTSWTRILTGTDGDLWWVWCGDGETMMLSGAGARVVTYTVSTGAFSEAVVTNPAYKLFGIWGVSASDVWAVGGDINGGLPGIALHYDGSTWTERFTATPDPLSLGTNRQIFKVWGSATDDVWFVGTNALLQRWNGTAVDSSYDSPVYHTSPLITVSGRSSSDVFAIGGFANGIAAHFDGSDWVDESPPPTAIAPAFNGVFASPSAETVACGQRGSFWWHDGTHGWTADPRTAATTRDFHACWVDETGEPWGVGGDLTSLTEGILITGNPDVPTYSP